MNAPLPSPNSHEWPWLTLKRWLRDEYGTPLFRVPIDPGFSCPNRLSDGTGGCTFCAEHGSKARQSLWEDQPLEQAKRGIEFARERYNAQGFILYLQSYTATFTDTQTLEELIEQLLPIGTFRMLALGTRPDCLSRRTLDMLERVNEQLDVTIDLGVQTSHDPTLERINRGHDWSCSVQAIQRLAERNLRPVAHLILGFPGESLADMRLTVERLASLPIAGMKFHNLHVLEGTQLAEDFARDAFPLLDEVEYAEVLIECLCASPSPVPIHRINTDSPTEERVGPHWTMKKGQFMNYVARRMLSAGLRQGCRISG